MNRHQRRNQDRRARADAAKLKAARPVVIAGDGIVAVPTGQQFEPRGFRTLPEKVPGQHRWVAVGSWTITVDQAREAYNPDAAKTMLDHESMLGLGIGCWDCERTLGEVPAKSKCPAPAAPE